MIVSMTPRTLSRTVSSIGSNQSSKSMVLPATAAVFVVFFVMAWSPFRRSNAGISWGEHPGDYANRISTTPATGPPNAQKMAVARGERQSGVFEEKGGDNEFGEPECHHPF